MDEEVVKLIIDLINKLDEKIEKKFEETNKDIEEIKRKINEELKMDFLEKLNEQITILSENLASIKDSIKNLDTTKLERIDKLIEAIKGLEDEMLAALDKLEKIEEEIPVMLYHVKDLTDYEEKLEELINKIDNWDKLFDIEEIEYYPERIETIKSWVEEQLKKGYSLDEIKEELIKNGYSSFFIHKVLKEIKK